jgi:hypothetical protein
MPINFRDYVTPEAFSVKPELLGTPLAKPRKRLMAWAVDALIVAIIGQLSDILLALALALLADRVLRQTRLMVADRWRQQLRYGIVALFVTWAVMQAYSQWTHRHTTPEPTTAARVAAATKLVDELARKDGKLPAAAAQKNNADSDDDNGDDDKATASEADRVAALSEKVERLQEQQKPKSFSLLDSIKNVLGDVGFDFGWAAVYWTLLTGWWNGQTLGKRLFGLRVVQLNGKPFTMWDSFNRCGGYAAGVATGLLGFAQVLWDQNRQAIHDKVSFTVVVDERREKIAWPIEGLVTRPDDE